MTTSKRRTKRRRTRVYGAGPGFSRPRTAYSRLRTASSSPEVPASLPEIRVKKLKIGSTYYFENPEGTARYIGILSDKYITRNSYDLTFFDVKLIQNGIYTPISEHADNATILTYNPSERRWKFYENKKEKHEIDEMYKLNKKIIENALGPDTYHYNVFSPSHSKPVVINYDTRHFTYLH